MKKKIIMLTVLVLSLGLITACAAEQNNNVETTEPAKTVETTRIIVSTTINPVDQIVRIIGGDKVEVNRIIPEGSETHDFEPSIRDMEALTKSDILFLNGLEMEPWADKAVETLGLESLEKVELSKGFDTIPLEEDDHEDEEEDDDHGLYDPHIWLSLDGLTSMATVAEDALSRVSPEDSDYFKDNLSGFKQQIEDLKNDYIPQFREFEGKSFVTGHAAFGYLTRDLGLVQKSIEGPFQEGEPTPRKLQELVDYAKANGITTIFLEEQASPKVSETLAREVGAKTESLNPLESSGELLETMKDSYEKILASFR
ncbi:MAG TPA: zinc ABC transporter substrate-binding protein [Clostridiaceae bacterium]|nr:zinc ABC transporter substrate-binding protein [Clostridiaceae bacterium]